MARLSAADWCFFKQGMDPATYYGKLAEMGYSGVEMVAPERFGEAQSAGLTIRRWPDGQPRTLLTRQPDTEGATWTWEVFGQVGWHPDDSAVVLRVTRLSLDTAVEVPRGAPTGPSLVGTQILLVDATDGSSTPIGPASVNDQSFDVWAPPATS